MPPRRLGGRSGCGRWSLRSVGWPRTSVVSHWRSRSSPCSAARAWPRKFFRPSASICMATVSNSTRLPGVRPQICGGRHVGVDTTVRHHRHQRWLRGFRRFGWQRLRHRFHHRRTGRREPGFPRWVRPQIPLRCSTADTCHGDATQHSDLTRVAIAVSAASLVDNIGPRHDSAAEQFERRTIAALQHAAMLVLGFGFTVGGTACSARRVRATSCSH